MATAMNPAGGLASSSRVSPRRRFRLLDAMILVAATAFASGLMLLMEQITQGQISWSALPALFESDSRIFGSAKHEQMIYLFVSAAFLVTLLALPFAAMWTLALIPIRLTGPRPRFRRLSCQPGMMAAISAGVALALVGMQTAVVFWQASDNPYAIVALAGVPVYPGLAVLIAWITLLVGGRWRGEPSWVDRLGRALGIYWILGAVFTTCVLLYGVAS
jgi:hypothetical protein